MTLYILWKGWRGRRERRDGIYRHWLLYVQNVCVYQGKYKYLRRCYSLSLRCDFSHHLSLSLPMCLTPPPEYGGGGTMVSTFPLSCREHSFVSCIPFPIHLFLSCPSWTGKNSCYSLHWRGEGSECASYKPLSPPPFLPVLLG